MLEVPRSIERKVRIPEGAPGPLETQVLQPMLVSMGIVAAHVAARSDDDENDYDDEPPEDEERPPSFPEMLKLAFDARLVTPEPLPVQPKWVAGAAFEFDCDFYKFVRSAELVKQEGLVLRHLLRLAILAGEFLEFTGDPDYERVGELATRTCHRVDPAYTDRFLADAAAIRKLAQSR